MWLCYLELRGGQVDAREALGDGVLHLQARVELEEVELVVGGVVQVLHRAGADVADRLRQALGGQLHLLEDLHGRDGRGALLEDLLETTLGTAAQRQVGEHKRCQW